MASVYRPNGAKKYKIAYIDENGLRRTVPGFRDKMASKEKARRLEQEAERIRAGLPVVQTRHLQIPLEQAIPAYLENLIAKGSPTTGPHYRESKRILNKIAKATNWKALRDIHPATFQEHLNTLAKTNSPRTRNRYHETLRAFCNWCVEKRYFETSPIGHLKMTTVGQKGRRRIRRAFTMEELQALLAVAPPDRAAIYLVAALSGYRKKELREMTTSDLSPNGSPPTWHLRADQDKSGRLHRVPIMPDIVPTLTKLGQGMNGQKLFAKIPSHITFQRDLKNANIEREDANGRWLDFHSFRYTFCSFLAKLLPIQIVKTLMRHSTIKLTADLYGVLGIEDTAPIVSALPKLIPGPRPSPEQKAQGPNEE